jgi:hypothetical protein
MHLSCALLKGERTERAERRRAALAVGERLDGVKTGWPGLNLGLVALAVGTFACACSSSRSREERSPNRSLFGSYDLLSLSLRKALDRLDWCDSPTTIRVMQPSWHRAPRHVGHVQGFLHQLLIAMG